MVFSSIASSLSLSLHTVHVSFFFLACPLSGAKSGLQIDDWRLGRGTPMPCQGFQLVGATRHSLAERLPSVMLAFESQLVAAAILPGPDRPRPLICYPAVRHNVTTGKYCV